MFQVLFPSFILTWKGGHKMSQENWLRHIAKPKTWTSDLHCSRPTTPEEVVEVLKMVRAPSDSRTCSLRAAPLVTVNYRMRSIPQS